MSDLERVEGSEECDNDNSNNGSNDGRPDNDDGGVSLTLSHTAAATSNPQQHIPLAPPDTSQQFSNADTTTTASSAAGTTHQHRSLTAASIIRMATRPSVDATIDGNNNSVSAEIQEPITLGNLHENPIYDHNLNVTRQYYSSNSASREFPTSQHASDAASTTSATIQTPPLHPTRQNPLPYSMVACHGLLGVILLIVCFVIPGIILAALLIGVCLAPSLFVICIVCCLYIWAPETTSTFALLWGNQRTNENRENGPWGDIDWTNFGNNNRGEGDSSLFGVGEPAKTREELEAELNVKIVYDDRKDQNEEEGGDANTKEESESMKNNDTDGVDDAVAIEQEDEEEGEYDEESPPTPSHNRKNSHDDDDEHTEQDDPDSNDISRDCSPVVSSTTGASLASPPVLQFNPDLHVRLSTLPPHGCDICIMEYEEGEEISLSRNPDCEHVFHKECILDWMQKKTTCPCCRRPYLEGTSTRNNNGDNSNSNSNIGFSWRS